MSRLDRALNVFSAMEKLPDEYIRSAEETLAEAAAAERSGNVDRLESLFGNQ